MNLMSKWKWLAGLMEEKNISQAELAKKIKWASPRISELLADKRDIPANKIRPLVSVFNINTDELLDYNSGYRKQIPSISRSFNVARYSAAVIFRKMSVMGYSPVCSCMSLIFFRSMFFAFNSFLTASIRHEGMRFLSIHPCTMLGYFNFKALVTTTPPPSSLIKSLTVIIFLQYKLITQKI